MPDNRELYCLNCFALIPSEAEKCPLCAGSIAALSAQGYREKLLHALEHPLDDVRMRAIIAIRLRGDAEAVLPLAECALRHPLNLEEGIEIVRALEGFRLSSDGRRAMEMLANGHPAHAVRIVARQAMGKNKGTTWRT